MLTGEELYVRAVVTSDRPPENPSFPDQKAQAWTQPVGWEGRIAQVGAEADGPKRPEIRKLGTLDLDMVEATPVVFKDRLYRFEYVRKDYKPNTTGDSYFRFIDVETGKADPRLRPRLRPGLRLRRGRLDVGLRRGPLGRHQGRRLQVGRPGALGDDPGPGVARLGAVQHVGLQGGRPLRHGDRGRESRPRSSASRSPARFAESKDLKAWKLLPEECVFTKERYSACPSIRHLDGMFYMTYLEARPGPRYETHVVRSKDLIRWESSPLNPVLVASDQDKAVANPKLTDEQRKLIAGAVDRNNSDVDFCEFRGKTIITTVGATSRGPSSWPRPSTTGRWRAS